MRNKGFTIIELFIVIFIVGGICLIIVSGKSNRDHRSQYRHLVVRSLQEDKIVYEGNGNYIVHYTFGTGVRFYDEHKTYHEIEGNAEISNIKNNPSQLTDSDK